LSFRIDEAAEHFIKGLFADQQFRLGDRLSQVDFGVQCIEAMPRPVFTPTMRYRCLSPMMITRKAEEERYARYLSPEAPGYGDYFIKNLLEKYRVSAPPTPGRGELAHNYGGWVNWGLDAEWQEVAPVFALLNTPRRKGIHIKQHTPQHTQLVGYTGTIFPSRPLPGCTNWATMGALGKRTAWGLGVWR